MELYGQIENFLSFKRIGYEVSNHLAEALIKKGLTEEQILDWLSSTRIRHCIDGNLGETIQNAVDQWVDNQDIDSFKF
jgi:hypothetical protein